MIVQDFLARVRAHPDLDVLYRDPTMCIIRCSGATGERRIRLGLWAVQRMHWEQIVEAFHFPFGASR